MALVALQHLRHREHLPVAALRAGGTRPIVITRPGGEPGGAQRGEQGVLHLIGSAQSVNAGVLG